MSMITSIVPARLNALIAPAADSPTVTWFGVGELVAVQFKLADSGRDAPAGNTVKKLDAVGLTTVTFDAIPVAVAGTVQFPLVPHTMNVAVSSAASGTPRPPTWSGPPRVSARRQGTIGTNDDAPGDPAAPEPDTVNPVVAAAANNAVTPT